MKIMSRKISIAFVAIISLTLSFSANAFALVEKCFNEGLRIRQKPDTEELLRLYHTQNFDSDTIYSVIIPVGNCPRCEATIPQTIKQLTATDPTKDIQLIVVYPDSLAAKRYLDKYGITAPYIKYDTHENYEKIYSFSPGYLHIPYLLKINLQKGELVVGVRVEDNSSEFLNEFCNYSVCLEKHIYKIDNKFEGVYSPSSKLLKQVEEYAIVFPDTIRPSEIIYQPEFYNEYLFFNDRLNEGIMQCKLEEKSGIALVTAKIEVSSEQEKTFVSVNDDYYQMMIEDKSLRNIPLSPKVIGNNLYVSYSLPKLWEVRPKVVGYMNQACVLKIPVDSIAYNHSGEVCPFDKESNPDFFYSHFSLYEYDGNIAIECQRMTWPMSYEKDEIKGKPIMDSFEKPFYSFSQPTVAVFDSDSLRLKHLLYQLPTLSEKTLTGYYFASPVLDSWKGEVAYSDGFSGKIILTGTKGDTEYFAYSVDEKSLPLPDSTAFYSYDCVEPYSKIFNRSIIEVKVTDSNIYCLVRYGEHGKDNLDKDAFSVIRIDKTTGKSVECTFPKSDAVKNKAFGLRRVGNTIQPYSISENVEGIWQLYIFE